MIFGAVENSIWWGERSLSAHEASPILCPYIGRKIRVRAWSDKMVHDWDAEGELGKGMEGSWHISGRTFYMPYSCKHYEIDLLDAYRKDAINIVGSDGWDEAQQPIKEFLQGNDGKEIVFSVLSSGLWITYAGWVEDEEISVSNVNVRTAFAQDVIQSGTHTLNSLLVLAMQEKYQLQVVSLRLCSDFPMHTRLV